MLALVAILLPWWQSSTTTVTMTVDPWTHSIVDSRYMIFLWGVWFSVNGQTALLVFKWTFAFISEVVANFTASYILVFASSIFILIGSLRKSSVLISIGSFQLLIAPLLFYTQMNILTNGRVIGNYVRAYPGYLNRSDWSLSIGFYLTIISFIIGFYSAYSMRKQIRKVHEQLKNERKIEFSARQKGVSPTFLNVVTSMGVQDLQMNLALLRKQLETLESHFLKKEIEKEIYLQKRQEIEKKIDVIKSLIDDKLR